MKTQFLSLTVKGLRKPPPAVYKVTHQLTTISCILTKPRLLVQRQWTLLSSEQQTVCFTFELPVDIYHQCPSSAGAGSASHMTTAHVGNWNQKLMKHIENIGLQGNLPDLCPRRSNCLLYWKTNQLPAPIKRNILYVQVCFFYKYPWKDFCWFSVAKSCPILCDRMDCSMPGLHVLHYLSKFAQVHVHWVGDAIQRYPRMKVDVHLTIRYAKTPRTYAQPSQQYHPLFLYHLSFWWIFSQICYFSGPLWLSWPLGTGTKFFSSIFN